MLLKYTLSFRFLACNCDPLGSIDLRCDDLSGHCKCKPGVIGRYCDQCKPNYYGFNTGNGCKPCHCSLNYSNAGNLQCDENGVCSCLPGISDKRCEEGCNGTSFNLTSKGKHSGDFECLGVQKTNN